MATNSVGYPIAVELPCQTGLVAFVPAPYDTPGSRVGAAFVNVAKRYYRNQSVFDPPDWITDVQVPGANGDNSLIQELTKKREQISQELLTLETKREELLNFTHLLFGYGKGVLEPQVRRAFRLFGFTVPEPEEYVGEWDIELRDQDKRTIALGEVEGSEGVIDVDKFRQLLDYIQDQAIEGNDYKGILIGNGFRLKPLAAEERQRQFSEHVLRGARKNSFCILPTTELFKALCAVLESNNDDILKATIRESLIQTVGVWNFLR